MDIVSFCLSKKIVDSALSEVPTINNKTVSSDSVWSSKKVSDEFDKKQATLTPSIDDYSTGGDVNDLVQSGLYTINDYTKWSNLPVKSHGMLMVFRSDIYAIQIYMRSVSSTDTSGSFIYYRFYDGSTWYDWTKGYDYDQVTTA